MELNAELIIEVLECCLESGYCATCPATDYCSDIDDLMGKALDLIKELTEENVELTRTCTALTHKVQVLDEQYNSLLDRNMELGDEVDGLKAHLDVSVAEQARLADEVADWKAIAEGYQKQFEDCAEDRARLTEENERLQCQVNRLKKYDEERDIALHTRLIADTRADTVREMWDRLKYTLCINNEENTEFFDYAYTLETIDQIAQETLEEK